MYSLPWVMYLNGKCCAIFFLIAKTRILQKGLQYLLFTKTQMVTCSAAHCSREYLGKVFQLNNVKEFHEAHFQGMSACWQFYSAIWKFLSHRRAVWASMFTCLIQIPNKSTENLRKGVKKKKSGRLAQYWAVLNALPQELDQWQAPVTSSAFLVFTIPEPAWRTYCWRKLCCVLHSCIAKYSHNHI